MSSFPILDLVVGVFFVYFLLSIICSSAVEIVLTMTNMRAKMLTKWFKKIFTQKVSTAGGVVDMWEAIINHCSTNALSDTNSATAYIDARNFTDAVISLVVPTAPLPAGVTPLQNIITSIRNSTSLPPELQSVFLNYATEAEQTFAAVSTKTASEIDIFKLKIEKWYDSNMERVGGSLKKRWARPLTFWLSFIMVIALNADTISIAQYLYSNPEARKKASELAYLAVKDSAFIKQVDQLRNRKDTAVVDTSTNSAFQTTDTTVAAKQNGPIDTVIAKTQTIRTTKAILEDVIPIGWNDKDLNDLKKADGKSYNVWLVILKLIRLVITVLAVMMGAPFWFEILNKIANVRGNGNKPKPQNEATTA